MDTDVFSLCAAPIALQLDWAHIYMLGTHPLQLSQIEANGYIDLLNSNLKNYDLRIVANQPMQWQLELPEKIELISQPPNSLIGQSIREFLPYQTGNQFWSQLFTEMQMLLYECAPNQARKRQHLPTVDAIWFWNEAAISPKPSFIHRILKAFRI